jgi:hypothetical protein
VTNATNPIRNPWLSSALVVLAMLLTTVVFEAVLSALQVHWIASWVAAFCLTAAPLGVALAGRLGPLRALRVLPPAVAFSVVYLVVVETILVSIARQADPALHWGALLSQYPGKTAAVLATPLISMAFWLAVRLHFRR